MVHSLGQMPSRVGAAGLCHITDQRRRFITQGSDNMKRNPIYAAVRRHALMSAGALALGTGGVVTAISMAQAADVNYAMTNLTTSGTGGTTASVSPGVLGAPASVQDNSGGALSPSIRSEEHTSELQSR